MTKFRDGMYPSGGEICKMGGRGQIFRLVDKKQHVLGITLNFFVTWFRKMFWLVIMVRFCHLSLDEDRFFPLVG